MERILRMLIGGFWCVQSTHYRSWRQQLPLIAYNSTVSTSQCPLPGVSYNVLLGEIPRSIVHTLARSSDSANFRATT